MEVVAVFIVEFEDILRGTGVWVEVCENIGFWKSDFFWGGERLFGSVVEKDYSGVWLKGGRTNQRWGGIAIKTARQFRSIVPRGVVCILLPDSASGC